MKYKTKEKYIPIRRHDNYEVSNLGNVRNKKTLRVLKPAKTKQGYLKVDLQRYPIRQYLLVHRVVMENFIPSSILGLQVNHLDGDKSNNKLSNLEYLTNKDNCRHAYQNEIAKKKLLPKDVIEIKRWLLAGIAPNLLAEKYGVCVQTITNIRNGRRWSWLNETTICD